MAMAAANVVGSKGGDKGAVSTQPKLLDRMREALRSRHYSHRTEETYCHWVKRFIHFHNIPYGTGTAGA